MSDAVQIQLIVGLVAVINGLILAAGTYFGQKLMASSRAAAAKTEEVAKTLETSTAATAGELKEVKEDLKASAKVAKATHTLVNSDRSVLLKMCATALRRVANDSNHPDDLAAAKLAEQAYESHQAAQVIVDAQPGTDSEKAGKTV